MNCVHFISTTSESILPTNVISLNSAVVRNMLADCTNVDQVVTIRLPFKVSLAEFQVFQTILTPPCNMPDDLTDATLDTLLQLSDFLEVQWLYDKLLRPQTPKVSKWNKTFPPYVKDSLVNKLETLISPFHYQPLFSWFRPELPKNNFVITTEERARPYKYTCKIMFISTSTFDWLKANDFEPVRFLISSIYTTKAPKYDRSRDDFVFHFDRRNQMFGSGLMYDT